MLRKALYKDKGNLQNNVPLYKKLMIKDFIFQDLESLGSNEPSAAMSNIFRFCIKGRSDDDQMVKWH